MVVLSSGRPGYEATGIGFSGKHRVGIKRRRIKRALGLLFVKSGINRHDKNNGSGVGRVQCALQCIVSRTLFDRDQCAASKDARESEVVVGIDGIKSLGRVT